MTPDLFSDDPVAIICACDALRAGDARLPGVRDRLIKLLDDGRDADRGDHVCAAAARALARLDPSGSWRKAAALAFRSHIERDNHDEARDVAAVIRSTCPADQYLRWSWDALRDRVGAVGGRASAAVNWLQGWESDSDLVEALLILDDASRTWVLRELLTREAVLRHMLRAEGSTPRAAEQWKAELASLSRWTDSTPDSLRQEVEARARECGLL